MNKRIKYKSKKNHSIDFAYGIILGSILGCLILFVPPFFSAVLLFRILCAVLMSIFLILILCCSTGLYLKASDLIDQINQECQKD